MENMNHQLENGHTQIANTLLEELCRYNISLNSLRVVLWAIRNTYGYKRKKTNPISMRVLSKEIKMSCASVQLAITVLVKNGILVKRDEGGYVFDKNKISGVQPTVHCTAHCTPKSVQPAGQSVQPTVPPPLPPYKEKENLKERGGRGFTPPTLEEVEAYCKQRNNGVNAKAFFYHYAAANWYRNKTKITNWKLCVCTWEEKDKERAKTSRTPEQQDRIDQRKYDEEQARLTNAKP